LNSSAAYKVTKSVWYKLILPLLLLAAVLLLFYFLRDIDGLHISFPELAAVPEDGVHVETTNG